MRITLIVALLFLLAGCAGTPSGKSSVSESSHYPQVQKPAKALEDSPKPETSPNQKKVVRTLIAQYDEWANTRYQLGGLSKQGIDCSGFVHVTFQSKFQKSLPRTTEQLAVNGQPVASHQLAPGDLVFFRISPSVRHVGIYLEDNRFLHASKSKGVIISNMQDEYWRSHYWQSRRISL